MRKILAVINQKGGVGKSSTALAVTGALRVLGRRALAIDLDSQGNLGYTMGMEGQGSSSFDLLTRAASAEEVIITTDQGDLIPSSPALAGADAMITQTGKEYRLKEALEAVADRYDHIIIDTPPALGILTINALTCAQAALVPAQADIYSLAGIAQLHQTIEAVRQYCNPELTVLGIVLTRHNPRSVLSRDLTGVIARTADQLGTRLLESSIRDAVAVREAQARRQGLFSYAPKSAVAADYMALTKELLELE